MGSKILFSDESRLGLLRGVELMSRAVGLTLGPSGRNVLIRDKDGISPYWTKDGVTVAGSVRSDDEVESLAIESLRDIASLSNDVAGDGTTTATILSHSIISNGLKLSRYGDHNVIDLSRGIMIAVDRIVSHLSSMSIDCDDDLLRKVALIASNYDEVISDVVLDAFKVAGNQGVVNIKRSRTNETYLTTIRGMNLPMGYMSPYFQTDIKSEKAILEDCYVYATNSKISKMTDNLVYLLSKVSDEQASILIICEDMDNLVLDTILKNHIRGGIKACVCKNPSFGQETIDVLTDLGFLLGSPPFIKNEGREFDQLTESEIDSLIPICTEVIVGNQQTSFKGAKADPGRLVEIRELMLDRADSLREKLSGHVNNYERGLLQNRISRLTDGLAFIHIGAYSDAEFTEKQHRVQDALHAVKGASEEGIVAGGGSAFMSIQYKLDVDLDSGSSSVRAGLQLLLDSLSSPFFRILENAGIEVSSDELLKISSNDLSGYDARWGVFVEDMVSAGIVDSVKTLRSALENAASISALMLTTDCVIVDKSAYEDKPTSPLF